jgi:hypothetical protein
MLTFDDKTRLIAAPMITKAEVEALPNDILAAFVHSRTSVKHERDSGKRRWKRGVLEGKSSRDRPVADEHFDQTGLTSRTDGPGSATAAAGVFA